MRLKNRINVRCICGLGSRSQEQRHAGGGAGGSVSGTIRRSLEDEAAEMTSFDHQLPSLNNDTKTEGTSRIVKLCVAIAKVVH